MEKIVVLNSGGFDSTVLMAELAMHKEYEIHSLYFDYGQLNSLYDSRCAYDNANKLGAIHHEVTLPKFEWTKNNFYSDSTNEYTTQYLEMRNVIFISYALSLAESIGATAIYAAILGNGAYKDTNSVFLEKMGNLCECLGIAFKTPYAKMDKCCLFYLARKLGVGTTLSYFSCDTPTNYGKPCGVCDDCKSLEYYEYLLNHKDTVDYFIESGLNPTNPDFKKAFMEEPIREMRVVLNNSCQLHCEHCYHGDNTLVDTILTEEELVNAIIDARNLGIKSIHFSGKEPLYDERIFRIIQQVKDKGIEDIVYTIVTNGINVPKYANQIKASGISGVFLSADDMYGKGVRNSSNSVVIRAINYLGNSVPVEIFFDLTPDNIGNVIDNIKYWELEGVNKFFIRTIRFVGKAKEGIPKLTVEQICKLYKELREYEGDSHIVLDIGAAPYAYDILLDKSDITEEIKDDLDKQILLSTGKITDHFDLSFELFCQRYFSQITLTADGYVLGCAMESSVQNYAEYCGSIRKQPLKNIILQGKAQSLEVNKKQCGEDCIFFEKCAFTPIDF